MQCPVKPLLKWVGGKSQILKQVMSVFPSEIQSYHEPFVGGGSVLLEVLRRKSVGMLIIQGKICAYDVNPTLIAFYNNVKYHAHELISELESLIPQGGEITKLYYYEIRTRFNSFTIEERQSICGSAILLFLNKTCFRGLYREGPNGFNVPYGNYKNPAVYVKDHILQVSSMIADVEFTCCRFEDALDMSCLQRNDFAYLDPPYAPQNTTSFVGYTIHGFNLQHHERLFEICKQMSDCGVRMAMSNAHVPLVVQAFPTPSFKLRTLTCRRAIHSTKPNTTAMELIITNFVE